MTADHDHRYALPLGHRLPKYFIKCYLGSGGFGITYLAIDENLDHQVAIKEYLPSDLAGGPRRLFSSFPVSRCCRTSRATCARDRPVAFE